MRKVVRGVVPAVVALAAALVNSPVRAWGAEAHRLIADVAAAQLTPTARIEVSRLLELEPGTTWAGVATWADETRSRATASWHYINLPRDGKCEYDPVRDCPGGQCVVAAIERQFSVLSSSARAPERLKALKYIAHLVADVHQPLHAGFADDRGGNLYQVQFAGRGTNLHAVWDVGLIQRWPGGPSALHASLQVPAVPALDELAPALWAEESCRAVQMPNFYPTGHVLPDDYQGTMAPVVLERLGSAARRLASVLNRALTNQRD